MTVKKKSLFDHVNQVTSVQNPSYWDEISDDDNKFTFSLNDKRYIDNNLINKLKIRENIIIE